MTQEERQVAYGHVLELHKQGLHHGDVEAGNFARRTTEASPSKNTRAEKQKRSGCTDKKGEDRGIVICEFSHCSPFDECDPEKCWDLQRARNRLLKED